MTIPRSLASTGSRLLIRKRTVVLLFFLIPSALILAGLEDGPRSVALPAFVQVALGLLFITVLWNRDGRLPIFELGSVYVAITMVYSVVPLLGFMSGGFAWSQHSDNRLLQYAMTPSEVGAFAWWYVVYLASFVVAYLVARGQTGVISSALKKPGRVTIVVIFAVFVSVYFCLIAVSLLFGISFDPSYRDLTQIRLPADLPYFLQQVTHNFMGMKFVVALCLLVILMSRWRERKWRYVMICWLLVETVVTTLRMSARSEMMLLLLAAILLYDRLVRAVSFAKAILAAAILLNGFLWVGLMRNLGGGPDAFDTIRELNVNHLAATNEFQSLFGTAYDLHMRKLSGELGEIPVRLYFSDFYLVIPSQLLPFEKLDHATWYHQLAGITTSGFMFGVVSQAIIGFGWWELAFRGALLGLIFALLHRTYAKHATSFWMTVFYLFLCIFSYYTFRASTFYILYFVVYRFVPVLVVVKLGSMVLTRAVAATTRRRDLAMPVATPR